ncbi:MAG TPA: UbiD family decarboxylase [Candidatus Scatomorpha merdavium]|nr:UbiD family decarboxylase [Candidatus Scatomorpha merdavium]
MVRFENGVYDLRSALEFLRGRPGQLAETEVEADPEAELSGVYRRVGAGGTVMRPTRTNGPAMLFRNLRGFPGVSAAIGVLASRERVAALLGCKSTDLGKLLCSCVDGPVEPVLADSPAPCQEVVHLASEPNFDLRRLLPAPKNTPLGYDELAIAGALRGEPVQLCRCVSVDERAIARAEFVIEGELVPGVRVQEGQNSGTGYAMPEFPGYNGVASSECRLLKVKALTHKKDPILQTCIGPSEEHVNMAGIPTEASILGMLERAMPGRVLNVCAHRSGGGKYMAVLQVCKKSPTDEGRQRQAALLAFSAFPELKHVILVDEDVDIFDTDDVLWALNTRYQGNLDTVFIPGVRCHPLDPSAGPEYSPGIADRGVSCKTIFDCTVPYSQKARFRRAEFLEADPAHWLPGWEG